MALGQIGPGDGVVGSGDGVGDDAADVGNRESVEPPDVVGVGEGIDGAEVMVKVRAVVLEVVRRCR